MNTDLKISLVLAVLAAFVPTEIAIMRSHARMQRKYGDVRALQVYPIAMFGVAIVATFAIFVIFAL